MKRAHGFSLVEVVLALGIVSFALLAMFSLLGNSLRSSADTLATTEALNARETLNEFLRTQWGGANFANAYANLQGGSLGDAYVFAFTNAQGEVLSGAYATNHPDFANVANRAGRLLRATFKLSPNFPINGSTNTPGNFTTNDLTNSLLNYSNAALGVKVDVYDVPGVDSPNFTNNRVLSYETTIAR